MAVPSKQTITRKLKPKKKPLPSQVRKKGDPRKKQMPEYKTFRLHRKIKPQKIKPLPSSWSLWNSALGTVLRNKKLFGIFLLVYGLLYLVLVQGFSGGSGVTEIKATLNDLLGQSVSGLLTSVSLFGYLLTTAGTTTTDIGAFYQATLLVIGSLAMIWLLREIVAGSKGIRVKHAFYKGMRPLVPFLLVIITLLIELIPMFIAVYVLNVAVSNALITSFAESAALYSVAFLLSVLSLYLVSGSFAALYIVTLPDAEPLKSIRSSHQLLAFHRWMVMRKLFMLGVYLLISAAIIFIPTIYFVPERLSLVADAIFFSANIAAFGVAHAYVYRLYRSLL